MHDAAAKQYNAIQYNKANPRHVMQTLTLPWVTQVYDLVILLFTGEVFYC